MKYYLQVDSSNVIWGAAYSDDAPGPDYVEVDFDPTGIVSRPTKHRLVNGALVDTGQPSFPSHPWMVWDAAQIQWIDSRDLAAKKDAKWEQIKAARAAAEYGGFTWDGSTFDSDLASQQKIMGSAQLASLITGYSVDWTLADNTVRSLTASDMTSVGEALGQHVNTQYVHARTLRQQIADAQTSQELESIVW